MASRRIPASAAEYGTESFDAWFEPFNRQRTLPPYALAGSAEAQLE